MMFENDQRPLLEDDIQRLGNICIAALKPHLLKVLAQKLEMSKFPRLPRMTVNQLINARERELRTLQEQARAGGEEQTHQSWKEAWKKINLFKYYKIKRAEQASQEREEELKQLKEKLDTSKTLDEEIKAVNLELLALKNSFAILQERLISARDIRLELLKEQKTIRAEAKALKKFKTQLEVLDQYYMQDPKETYLYALVLSKFEPVSGCTDEDYKSFIDLILLVKSQQPDECKSCLVSNTALLFFSTSLLGLTVLFFILLPHMPLFKVMLLIYALSFFITSIGCMIKYVVYDLYALNQFEKKFYALNQAIQQERDDREDGAMMSADDTRMSCRT